MDDGLDLTRDVDKALYDADRELIAQLIDKNADPDDDQWRHDYLHNIAEFRNALRAYQKDRGQYFLKPRVFTDNELASKPVVRNLLIAHKKLLRTCTEESVSAKETISEMRRYVATVN